MLANAGPALFSVHDITKVYRMGEVEVHALRGIDLEVQTGEFVVLLGASGSGKSTLLNILGGLDTPTSGDVRFEGRDMSRAREAELTLYRRRYVGFVFQFYNLIPSLTARENVALVTDIASDPMPPEEALARVGLAERLDHFPSQLSGGEQQRIAIARAIAKRPRVLFCDEPTGALDYETGKLVLEAIERINAELGTTVMVITHNAAIAGMGDRVLKLGFLLAAMMLAMMPHDVFEIPLIILPTTYLFAGAAVAVAGVLSALVVRHRIDHLDLVAVLKTRE